MVFCRSQATAGLALLTRRYGIRGYATSVHTACASGGQAIGTALKLIRRGAVDRVLAGGFDSMISPIGIARLLPAVRAVARQRHAAAREPPVRRDAQRLPAGRGRGLPRARGVGVGARARRAHLRRARRRRQFAVELPDHRFAARRRRADPGDARRRSPTPARRTADIDYINAHGTSTRHERPQRDAPRSARCSARDVDARRVSSTKSTMGHLIAAAGAVEVVVCALAIARGEMPVNANLASATPTATSTSSPARRAAAASAWRCPTRSASAARTAASCCAIPRKSTASAPRATSDDATPRVVITGTGAVCAAGTTPDDDPRRGAAPGARAIAPDHAVGHDAAGRRASPARSPTSIRARWSTTASCTS